MTPEEIEDLIRERIGHLENHNKHSIFGVARFARSMALDELKYILSKVTSDGDAPRSPGD